MIISHHTLQRLIDFVGALSKPSDPDMLAISTLTRLPLRVVQNYYAGKLTRTSLTHQITAARASLPKPPPPTHSATKRLSRTIGRLRYHTHNQILAIAKDAWLTFDEIQNYFSGSPTPNLTAELIQTSYRKIRNIVH